MNYEYEVLDYFYLNKDLIKYLESIKNRVEIYLFSDGALHAVTELENRVQHLFKQTVTAEELGLKKSDPQAHRELLKKLKVSADETIFVDDKDKNIAAARVAGMQAVQFIDNDQIIPRLEQLLAG